jgi:hypothetical protein
MILSRIRGKRGRTDAVARARRATRPGTATEQVAVAQQVFTAGVFFDGSDQHGEKTRTLVPSVRINSGMMP